jgi:hypothetical protein
MRFVGHMGYDNMTKLPVIASGLNSLLEVKKAGESSCEPCIMSMQHRLPFKISITKSTRMLDLLHINVCEHM